MERLTNTFDYSREQYASKQLASFSRIKVVAVPVANLIRPANSNESGEASPDD
jgi:hypothetical protein